MENIIDCNTDNVKLVLIDDGKLIYGASKIERLKVLIPNKSKNEEYYMFDIKYNENINLT